MLDLSLQQVLFRLLAYLVIAGLHGLLIAAFARALGAMGPSHDGRLTPSPFAHLDLLGLVSAVGGLFGWIRPVGLQAEELRLGRTGLIFVAVLALAATLAIALLLWAGRSLVLVLIDSDTIANAAIVGLRIGVEMAVMFVLINLLPVPPLTGGLILQAATPRLAALVQRGDLFIRLGLAALIVPGLLSDALQPLTAPLRTALLGG